MKKLLLLTLLTLTASAADLPAFVAGPQPINPPTAPRAVMVIVGWDVATYAIIYGVALPYASMGECEDALEEVTPESSDRTAFASECLGPPSTPL